MAKSLRSKKERAKRREKRYKDRLPREKARLQKLAEAALAREAQEEEEREEAGAEKTGLVRWRKKVFRYNHVRSLRSRPVAYQTQEIVPQAYVAERRDYDQFLDHTEGDSDDNDILSDSDTEFQEASRCMDMRPVEAKERAMELDGVIEQKLNKLKSKGKLPKWLSRQDKKKMKAYKKRDVEEDDLIFDYA